MADTNARGMRSTRVIGGRTPRSRAAHLGVLARRNFTFLAGGQLLSGLGTQVTLLALPTLAVLHLRASATEVGFLVAAGYLAAPVVGLPSGVVVERMPVRGVMVTMDALRVVLVGMIPLSALLGFLTLPLLCGVAFAMNGATVVYQTASQSLLPSLVDRDELVDANAVLAASQGVTAVGGPSLGGVLVSLLGAADAVLADMASYVISLLAVLAIEDKGGVFKRQEGALAADGARQGRFRADLLDGIRFVAGQPELRRITLTVAVLNLGGGAVGAVVYPYVYRVLHLSPSLVGGAFAAGSAGIFVGAVAGRRAVRGGTGWGVLGAAIGAPGAFLLLLAAAGTPVGGRFVLVAAYNCLFTICAYVLAIYQQTLRQLLANKGMQARSYSVVNTAAAGTVPLGALLGAGLATLVGLRGVIALGSAAGLAGAALLMPPPKMDALAGLGAERERRREGEDHGK